MRLQNKISLITGAARGIGLSTAIRFAQEGAIVILTDLDEIAGESAQTEVRKTFPSKRLCLHGCDRTRIGPISRTMRFRTFWPNRYLNQ